MYLIISKTCRDCGADVAVKLTTEKPNESTIREVEESIGGGFCISSIVFEEIEPEEIVVYPRD